VKIIWNMLNVTLLNGTSSKLCSYASAAVWNTVGYHANCNHQSEMSDSDNRT